MAFGLIDTSYIDFPNNVDDAYLRGLTTRAGVQFTEIARRLDSALGGLNEGVDALLATMLAPPTTRIVAAGGRTSGMKTTRRSQYTLARPQLVERKAHMLSIDEHEIALGFTEDGLMEMSLDDIQANIDALVAGFETTHRVETLSRLFSSAEIPVDHLGKTAQTSPGFAGSGTGQNVFEAVYPDGSALPGGYTHYYRDTTANAIALIKSMRDRLKKWHQPPYDLLGSQAVIDIIRASADFVASGSMLVRPGLNTAEALVSAEDYIGVLHGDIRVRHATELWTEANFVVWKSYGNLSERNPLVWRYDPLRGPDAYVKSRELYPLAEAVAIHKFGVNVNDRTGAALGLLAASGSYAPPTLTY